jgi:hypothetical protein
MKHYGRAIAWILNRVDGNQLEKTESDVRELYYTGGKGTETIGPMYFGNISNYMKDPEKKYLGDDDTLIIQCEILIYARSGRMLELLNNVANEIAPKTVDDFASFYDNEKFSDVTLVVGDKKIAAHRNILSARSEYFARMFDSDFKESKDKIVKIQEDNEELFKLLIKLIYTNDYSELSYEIAMDLIILAQKYNFPNLIKSCSRIIFENLKVETCVEILAVAESAQSEDLKTAALNFVLLNLKTVMETEKWKKLVADPTRALEITKKALQ